MLKAFATDERFTYENLVETQDFTDFAKHFTQKELDGFFDLYLKSVRLPKVKVVKKGKKGYAVSLPNIDFSMPVEILTSRGYERHILSSTPVIISSDTPIQVDPRNWYILDKK